MCRGLSVGGYNRPAVGIIYKYSAGTHIYHWLDAYGHTCFQPHTRAAFAVVWYGGVLVHTFAYAVTGELAHDAVTVSFGVGLNRVAYIVKGHACSQTLNRFEKAILGNLYKPFLLFGNVSYQISSCAVAVVTVLFRHDIHADYVAVKDNSIRRNTVNYDFVYGNARTCGIALVTKLRGVRPARSDILIYKFVHFFGRHSRAYAFTYKFQSFFGYTATFAH